MVIHATDNMSWKKTERLMVRPRLPPAVSASTDSRLFPPLQDSISHFAKFPATGVSLRQMVQFGEKPSIGKSLAMPLNCITCPSCLITHPTCCSRLFSQVPCFEPPNSWPRSFP